MSNIYEIIFEDSTKEITEVVKYVQAENIEKAFNAMNHDAKYFHFELKSCRYILTISEVIK